MIEKLKYTLDKEHTDIAEAAALLADKINELCEAVNKLEGRLLKSGILGYPLNEPPESPDPAVRCGCECHGVSSYSCSRCNNNHPYPVRTHNVCLNGHDYGGLFGDKCSRCGYFVPDHD